MRTKHVTPKKANSSKDVSSGSAGSNSETKRTVTFDDNDLSAPPTSSDSTLRGGTTSGPYLKGTPYLQSHERYADCRGFEFESKEVRAGFIRKVYSLLFCQLAITTAIIASFVFSADLRKFAMHHIELFYVAMAIYFVIMIILYCCPNSRRQHPLNLFLLLIFTLSVSYMVGLASIVYKTQSILLAFGICAVCCLAITVFAMTSTIDFTKLGIYLFVALVCLMIFGIILMFIKAPIAHKIYAGLGALLFMMYLIYDTQLIMGGRTFEIGPDEYVHGTLTLYLDIIQIFLFLLQLFGERRE